MDIYSYISPIAFSIFGFDVYWYGIMYLLGFLFAWLLAKLRRNKFFPHWSDDVLSDLIFYGAVGVILGGRLGYVLFYDLPKYIDNPSKIFKVWEGGMAFHGGMVGVLLGVLYFAYKYKEKFLAVMDFAAPLVPIGLGLGRIGNFLNAELYGKITDVPWGVIFPKAGNLARHPSQIYQFLLEGVLLFIIIWIFSSKKRPNGSICGLFAICYGIFRFIVEFVRLPDAHIGYIAFGWLTMGQILSSPMIIVGIMLMIYAYKKYPVSQ